MKRDYIDFHAIPDHLIDVHQRFLNWARWVRVHHNSGWVEHPMWRYARSNSRQWHQPEHRETCDLLDAEKVENQVRKLVHEQRLGVRWYYVDGSNPRGMARKLGMTNDRMLAVIHQGMQKVRFLLDNN